MTQGERERGVREVAPGCGGVGFLSCSIPGLGLGGPFFAPGRAVAG